MLLYIGLSVILIYITSLWWMRRKLPKGPWCLPILGYLLWIDPKAPYKTLYELSKKYGPVYGLYMGNIYTVVLSDAKIIKKVFSKDTASGRAPLYLTHGLMKGCGLICAEGELWKDQRKFVFNFLRRIGGTKFSSSRYDMETLIHKHVEDFLSRIREADESVSYFYQDDLRHSLGSFMNQIIFGEFWARDDETWQYLQHLQEEGVKYIGIAGPLNFIPMLRFLSTYRNTVQFLTSGLRKTHKIYDQIIERHQKLVEHELEHNPEYNPDNLLDAFLLEKKTKKDSFEYKFYSDQQLRYLLADMFGAGLDTTLTTLNWYLLFMSIHKNLQKSVHEELSSVLQNRSLSTDDFQYLPLFEASIAEVQRIRSTVPVGIPHGALENIEIDGFLIPKNSMIIPLQWAVHMNDSDWEEPNSFNPYRFLEANGRFMRPDNFIPFQTGKRMCVGEELAKMILYIFCSSIILEYEVMIEDRQEIDLNGTCGITLNPQNYKLNFKRYKDD